MSFYAISALANTVTSIVLGVLILWAAPKEKLNRSFFFATSAVALWSFAYFMWQIAADANTALYWVYWLMAGSIFISPTYFYFVTTLLGVTKRFIGWVAFGFIQAIGFLTIVASPFFIAGVESRGSFSFWPIPGPLYHVFLLISWAYIVAAAIFLFRHRKTSTGATQSRITYILIATLIGYIGGYTNYFLWYNIPIPPFGNISTAIYIALVAYAIMRHRLFNMKLIAAELLIFCLWLFIFVRMLLAEVLREQIIEGTLLLASLVIGVLLIRSVDKEVQQREEIQELSNQKSEFMSFASHEIRNPITAMRGYASLILDGTAGTASPQVKDAARKVLTEGNDVLRLISQYLSKSKLELGQLTYAHDPFDLGAAVDSIIGGYQPHAEERGLTLKKRIDLSQNLTVLGDEGKTKEVIGNLIDNALKYTRKGGVTVIVERLNGSVRAEIQDTGAGIPASVIPQLFKKFSRADAKKMNLLGTGLGLYLGKVFVEAQGGKIWAESDGEGKGARFIVEFPAA